MVYRQTERSRRIRAESRRKILGSARKLFAGQGYTGTTMKQIVEDAGTSIGNLYFYYRNKESLLATLIEEMFEEIFKWADSIIAGMAAGPERLAVAAYTQSAGALENADLIRIALAGDASPGVRDLTNRLHRNRMRTLLGENVPWLVGDELEYAATAWSGSVRRALERVLLEGKDPDRPTRARHILRYNLRGVGFSPAELERAFEAIDGLDAKQAVTRRAS